MALCCGNRNQDDEDSPQGKRGILDFDTKAPANQPVFSQEELDSMRVTFESMDTDGDGTITKEEFVSALKEMGESTSDSTIDKMWQEVDLDGSGGVEFEEFVKLTAQVKKAGGGGALGLFTNAAAKYTSFVS